MAKSKVPKAEIFAVAVVAFIAIVVLPLVNAFAPSLLSNFAINLYGQYLCLAIVAVGVDLLWGYTGLLSLGQMLFFSLGAYALGMHLMLMIGKLGQYYLAGNNPKLLPDFMVFLGYPDLPAHWFPFRSFAFAASAVVWVPALIAAVFGYLAFRSRIKGVYFSILTQALTYAASLLFFRNDFTFGGNNGFTDFKTILGHSIWDPGTQRGLYIATAVTLLLVYAGCRWLTTTKFGLVQRAIRDSENRVLFSGYAAANFKLFIFVIAAIIAALGGALYVPQVGIINPSQMQTDKSLEVVVWVAVGGRGTLVGPVIGAIFVNALKSYATRAFPEYWLIILGTLFILVVLFMPKGIVGLMQQVRDLLKKRKQPQDTAVSATGKPTSTAPQS
jgi:urea transport system permease protein